MTTFLSVILFLVTILLIFFVSIQSSKGDGLGAIGGGSTLFSVKNKGWEATLDKITVVLSATFLLLCLVVTALE